MTLRGLGVVLLVALVAACGVDGEPERPEPRPAPGVTITGTSSLGVSA